MAEGCMHAGPAARQQPVGGTMRKAAVRQAKRWGSACGAAASAATAGAHACSGGTACAHTHLYLQTRARRWRPRWTCASAATSSAALQKPLPSRARCVARARRECVQWGTGQGWLGGRVCLGPRLTRVPPERPYESYDMIWWHGHIRQLRAALLQRSRLQPASRAGLCKQPPAHAAGWAGARHSLPCTHRNREPAHAPPHDHPTLGPRPWLL